MRKIILILGIGFFLTGILKCEEEKPSFKFLFNGSVEYNDNIYLKDDGKEGEFVVKLIPGFSLKYPTGKTYFEFTTKLEYQNIGFGDYDVFYPSAKILLRRNLCEWASFGIWDNYQRGEVPGELGKDFDLNTVGIQFKKQFTSKISGKIGYSYQYLDYPGTQWSDYNKNKISAGLSFVMGPRTNFGVNLDYVIKDFEYPAGGNDLKDFTSFGVKLDIERKVGTKSTFGIYGGFISKNYDKVNPSPGDKRASESSDEFINYGLYFSLPATAKTSFKIYYDKGVQDTYYIYPGEVIIPPGSSTINVIESTYRDVETDRVGLSVVHKFGEKTRGSLHIAYAKNKAGIEKLLPGSPPPNKPLDESIFEVGTSLDYIIMKNLKFAIGYTYGSRDSEVRGDYTYNKFSVGIKYLF